MLRVSVIVPVFNGARTIEDCLDAILGSSRLADECIVVDDASTDGTSALVTARPGVTLIRSSARKGPAVARNKGAAHATGDILVFVDADVLLHPDTLARAISVLENDPGLAAVFGSYDDQPAHPSFLSQYRNLFHHWVHQTGNTESATIWSGCGAVRSDVFLASGGFDPLFR